MAFTTLEKLHLQILYIQNLQEILGSKEKINIEIKERASVFINSNAATLEDALEITSIDDFKKKYSSAVVTYDEDRISIPALKIKQINRAEKMSLRERIIFEAACVGAEAITDSSSLIQKTRRNMYHLSLEEANEELISLKQLEKSFLDINQSLPFALKDSKNGWEITDELSKALEGLKLALELNRINSQQENHPYVEINEKIIQLIQTHTKTEPEKKLAVILVNLLQQDPENAKQNFISFMKKFKNLSQEKKNFISKWSFLSKVDVIKSEKQRWLEKIASYLPTITEVTQKPTITPEITPNLKSIFSRTTPFQSSPETSTGTGKKWHPNSFIMR